jgi:hypothetical protein
MHNSLEKQREIHLCPALLVWITLNPTICSQQVKSEEQHMEGKHVG